MTRKALFTVLFVISVVFGLLTPVMEALAATFIINTSQGSQSVSTGDEVIVTGTGTVTATSSNSGIAGGSSDNVAVTVQSSGQIIANGNVSGGVAGKGIYLGNNASIAVNAGGTVKNLGKDPSGSGSIAGNAIYVGNNATIDVLGTVLTDKLAGGYNNWSQGISAGSGSTITVGGSGSVTSNVFGGKSIYFRSGSGNVVNLYGNASLTNDLANDGTAGGAIINFGYTGSAVDNTANTTISGKIGSTGNAWNGRVYGGTNTVTDNVSFRNLQFDAGTELSIGGTLTVTNEMDIGVNSSNAFGHITSTGNTTADGSALNVLVGGYISDNAQLDIINGAAGSSYNFTSIASTDPYVSFSSSILGGVLTLTASRSATNFYSDATNSNAQKVGQVLDNIASPSGDMSTVIYALTTAPSSQVASSLNTMYPTADRGVIETVNEAISKFTQAVVLRLQDSKVKAENNLWAQTYGDYANQNGRGSSNGYLARLWGTAIGIDRGFLDNRLRLGFVQGFAGSQILSADSSGRTGATSYQSGLYGEYQGKNHPYTLDAVFSYGRNDLDSSRSVTAGAINRTASAAYHSEQFSSYLEAGYKFKAKACDIIPLFAIDYTHLHLTGINETGANSLNLNVDAQNYDTLQVGPGCRFSRAFDTKNMLFTPELHFRYFYSALNDNQQTLASFLGGGTTFQTNGYRPAASSFNLGARLEFFNKKNLTFLADCDTGFKDGFYEIGGSATVKYSF